MDDETHRYIDKSVEVVSAQNDSRFTKASSEVKDVQAEMSVTKTELGAKVDGVETQVGSLRTELTAKVDGVETQVGSLRTELTAKVDSSKTELTAKVDGVEAQVGSSKTELTAKIDSLDAKMESGFERLNDRLKAQNPLTAWQIVGIVIGAIFGGTTLLAGILFGFLSISGTTLAAPDNRAEIAEIVAEALAQREADSSRNALPEMAPGIQGQEDDGSSSTPADE